MDLDAKSAYLNSICKAIQSLSKRQNAVLHWALAVQLLLNLHDCSLSHKNWGSLQRLPPQL
ncbi:hypothetical protein AM1_1830 [Acaryochloris marina MBIC11017]|uniref:Uncharacterized protein n=1 Tax=Acaryochloris marina (strain MBIC 11017) TaxID=329726 RepID=B0CDC5_ACAM1|nr:hypothetical protein AM1_1830 [Acaryochloris marina MBIC11017]